MRLPRRKGEYRLLQWANDWLSLDSILDGRPAIASPRGAMPNEDEYDRLEADYQRFRTGDTSTGFFWNAWELDPETRTIRARPATVRSHPE